MARELERGRVEVLEEGSGPLEMPRPTGREKKVLAFVILTISLLVSLLPLVVPAIPVWMSLLAALALFAWGVWTLSASMKQQMRQGGAEIALDQVTSQLVETDAIPEDFRDFVERAGQYKSDWPAT
jgi:hypothetical protein